MKLTPLVLATLVVACDTTNTTTNEAATEQWRGQHVHTATFGSDDNSEVVKMLPGGGGAVLIASKARKLTLLAVSKDGLRATRTVALFTTDGSESELTHVDIAPNTQFAAITRTLPVKTRGELTDCEGSLVFVNITDTDQFGTVIAELPVGPMPDAVDISPNGRWVVTADEVDYNDGKCPLPEVSASITIIELSDGQPTNATIRTIVEFAPTSEGARREPEQIVFGGDNNTIAATLQDTHELLTMRLDSILSESNVIHRVSAESMTITRLPNRSTGAEPWPDGVACFVDAQGQDYFAVAGEYNDTFSLFDLDGQLVNHIEIRESDMPSYLPRNIEDWSHAPFRPDSVSPFVYEGHSYLAFSLKHAGAVGVWNVDDVHNVAFVSVVKVGSNDEGTAVTESSIGTEGISAGSNGLVITANEDESSASLVGPVIN